MLNRLSIKNVALIERLNIEFDNGFNVLTGETGAGKSIIIDAVNLALGERASKELIKSGAEKASVEAEFDISASAAVRQIMQEYELDPDEGLTISRELSVSGKNVCRVNGTLVNLATLKQITDLLVDVHGQHEHQSLLSQNRHITFLDSFCHDKVDPIKSQVKEFYREYKASRDALLGGFSSEDERAREMDILRYQINEIEKAALTEAEEASLNEEKGMLMNAEKIMAALQEGCEALTGDSGAVDLVKMASGSMDGISGLSAEYNDAAKKLEEAYYAIQDIGYVLQDMRNSFEFDPIRIDEIQQRLEVYSNIKKKYGPAITDVDTFLENSKMRLDELESAGEKREQLEQKLNHISEMYIRAASELTSARKAAAEQLRKELLLQLKDLGMEKARFEVGFEPVETFGANGMDKVEFTMSANPGEALKPLEKVASGGEMSRIMLAFKAIAARSDSIPTLIFDEIDTGISGRIASVVGGKMVNISDSHQVLCVTHLPQIAALADAHFMVEKSDDGEHTKTDMRRLTLEERYAYLARMMDGAENSTLAYDHAKELITASENTKAQRRKGTSRN
ncbi:MAG: DNA repair protein RecN [Clostridia bacterium]|nr:DNA repair protein RecN [Clostridia bacterium]